MADIPTDLDWIRAAPENATGPGPWIEIAFGEGDDDEAPVYLRETSDPATVVTTNRRKWDAFVLGVQAGEFDHFVEGVELDGVDGTAPARPEK
ncbi:DUF397 domain-containing protein [Streptomyces poonensis]|uniref:DUF397 domain-containing protein n=1 Tax=Streptomyces poonensis TaxID=68255 RepID=A0A918UEH7_9ACTN|nr:DUF397 domain-containing protein [Streptomyces poonensis]GGY96410.1 hypothetical protein GCM10010365_14240 [Streptomyces poonensis]GLJ88955.1 hypothetical protein GCM10017589_15550 [Streptomyces poonensis]